MANIVVPRFDQVLARPVNQGIPPLGIAALTLGDDLGGLAAQIFNNKKAKEAAYGFADAMESDDPAAAKMYRAMADNMPLYDPSQIGQSTPMRGGGSGVAHGGGSAGGITGNLMSDMFDQIQSERKKSAAIAVDNAKSANDAFLARLHGAISMGVDDHHTGNEQQLIKDREASNEQLAKMKDELAKDPTNPRVIANAQKAQKDAQDIDYKLQNLDFQKQKNLAGLQESASKLQIAQQNADTARMRATNPAGGGAAKSYHGIDWGSVSIQDWNAYEADAQKAIDEDIKNTGGKNSASLRAQLASDKLRFKTSGGGAAPSMIGGWLGSKGPAVDKSFYGQPKQQNSTAPAQIDDMTNFMNDPIQLGSDPFPDVGRSFNMSR